MLQGQSELLSQASPLFQDVGLSQRVTVRPACWTVGTPITSELVLKDLASVTKGCGGLVVGLAQTWHTTYILDRAGHFLLFIRILRTPLCGCINCFLLVRRLDV